MLIMIKKWSGCKACQCVVCHTLCRACVASMQAKQLQPECLHAAARCDVKLREQHMLTLDGVASMQAKQLQRRFCLLLHTVMPKPGSSMHLLWMVVGGASPLLRSAWSSLKMACLYDLIFSSMSLLWQLCTPTHNVHQHSNSLTRMPATTSLGVSCDCLAAVWASLRH